MLVSDSAVFTTQAFYFLENVACLLISLKDWDSPFLMWSSLAEHQFLFIRRLDIICYHTLLPGWVTVLLPILIPRYSALWDTSGTTKTHTQDTGNQKYYLSPIWKNSPLFFYSRNINWMSDHDNNSVGTECSICHAKCRAMLTTQLLWEVCILLDSTGESKKQAFCPDCTGFD